MMSTVVLRTSESEVCRIRCGPALQEFAMRWNYIVRQRHRWADDAEARRRQSERLQQDFRKLGVFARHLRRLSGVVEVGIPYSRSDEHWEAKILPWEYVLAAATKPHRADEAILVVRHLKTGRRKRTRQPKTYAMIETAPGALSEHFDFAAERTMVTGSLAGLLPATEGLMENPTARQMRSGLAGSSPDVIHVTGVDNRSGRQLSGRDLFGVRDGLILADSTAEPKEYRAEAIAKMLNAGTPNPLFVGLNCWDSAARLAPMTIAAGARSAIGFQHTFDEAVAEVFFLNFYQSCMRTGWNTLEAFCSGWSSITRFRPRIRGSSIVLWSADSLVQETTRDEVSEWIETVPKLKRVSQTVDKTPRSANPALDRISDLLQVSVRPKPRLNYSSLHNGESLFDQFTIWFAGRSHQPAEVITQVDDLEIEVELHVGAESYPFRSRIKLSAEKYRFDLEDMVTLPLTSEIFRTIQERIQTSLFVDVRWHDQVLYRDTHSIWVAPIDQWTLEDQQIGWLPSFVQPRDPAVARTVNIAQDYLQCLTDQIGAGFDGYQSYDGFAKGIDCWAGVDRQVRSIWSALLLGTKLRYINPPPSYAEFTQRLRTPGETVGRGFGTCVDLAILLASCLEWVEIHPALFLLNGHVFPGYWKDLAAYRGFLDVVTPDLPSQKEDAQLARDERLQPWVSGRKTYAEIKGYVDRGELVPLETIALTTGKGFAAAIDEGRRHFYKKRSRAFRAMIDLVSARKASGVTPLPIFFSDQHVD